LLDLPIRKISPFSGIVIEGTAERGARSETEDCVRWRPGLVWIRGGEEDRIPVVEVGIGVGYLAYTASRSDGEERAFLVGRGSPGEELNGSNAGKRRFTPVFEGELGWALILLGDESIIADIYQDLCLGESLFEVDSRPAAQSRPEHHFLYRRNCKVV
jgi:hypothetical protein